MRVLTIPIADLKRLIELTRQTGVQRGVSTGSLADLSVLEVRLEIEQNILFIALDIVELVHKNSPSPEAADIVAPIHETLYNALAGEGIGLLMHLWRDGETDQELAELMRELFPDNRILVAILQKVPLVVSLVHGAEVQLRTLKKRTAAVRRLIETINGGRSQLPINSPSGFERFMQSLEQLARTLDLIPWTR